MRIKQLLIHMSVPLAFVLLQLLAIFQIPSNTHIWLTAYRILWDTQRKAGKDDENSINIGALGSDRIPEPSKIYPGIFNYWHIVISTIDFGRIFQILPY